MAGQGKFWTERDRGEIMKRKRMEEEIYRERNEGEKKKETCREKDEQGTTQNWGGGAIRKPKQGKLIVLEEK